MIADTPLLTRQSACQLTTRGLITERSQDKGRTWAHVAISCEKADGTKMIIGAASTLEE